MTAHLRLVTDTERPSIRPCPVELLNLMGQTNAAAHEIIREEAFPAHGQLVPQTLYRCRCGGLYSRDGIGRHLAEVRG